MRDAATAKGGNELMAPVGRQTVSLSITMATLAVYSLKVRLLIKRNYSKDSEGCVYSVRSGGGGSGRRAAKVARVVLYDARAGIYDRYLEVWGHF